MREICEDCQGARRDAGEERKAETKEEGRRGESRRESKREKGA